MCSLLICKLANCIRVPNFLKGIHSRSLNFNDEIELRTIFQTVSGNLKIPAVSCVTDAELES